MNIRRIAFVSLICGALAVGCGPDSSAVTIASSADTIAVAAPESAGRTIEITVRDPDGPQPDLAGVTVHVDRVEEYVEEIPKVALDAGTNMRVESCEAAAADPALGELPCLITERDRWRSVGEVLAVELDASGKAVATLPDPNELYSIWIDDIDDGAGCGHSGRRRVPDHRDDVVMNLDAWCS